MQKYLYILLTSFNHQMFTENYVPCSVYQLETQPLYPRLTITGLMELTDEWLQQTKAIVIKQLDKWQQKYVSII